MDQEIKITNGQWSELTSLVKETSKQTNENTKHIDQLTEKIGTVEDNNIALPLAIKLAVEEGLAPVVQKLLEHDNKFTEWSLMKERDEKERVIRKLEEEKDRKKWLARTIVGSFLAAIIGPAVTILGYIIYNNG